MTLEEKEKWCGRAAVLRDTYNEYFSAAMSFRSSKYGRSKFEKEKEHLVRSLKHQLQWPPFSDYANISSPFAFDECYDSLDTYMEDAINSIINREI